jgi:hypothetical protein
MKSWIIGMKSWIIGIHYQLGGSPSNETLFQHGVSVIWQMIDIFNIYRNEYISIITKIINSVYNQVLAINGVS